MNKREEIIKMIAQVLREVSFVVDFRVKNKPQGVKIIIELTQEQQEQLFN